MTHDEAVALWAVRSIDVQKRIETEGHGLIRLSDFATALRELARDYGLPEDWTNSGEAIGALKAARRKSPRAPPSPAPRLPAEGYCRKSRR